VNPQELELSLGQEVVGLPSVRRSPEPWISTISTWICASSGGKVVITYSWGNQQGTEFLAEAAYGGSLEGFFP
jgi:hypothetical protein